MSVQVNIAEAKAKLSELVARAEAGEEVVIARHGRPAVVLQPKVAPATGERQLGVWEHLGLDIPLAAFEPDPEVAAWVDKPVFPEP